MRAFLSIIFFQILTKTIFSASSFTAPVAIKPSTFSGSDSVVFDMKSILIGSGYIDLPIYLNSSHTVNTLDFSLKFDETILQYDSIINHQSSHLTVLPNLNPIDRKLRLTSNSLQTIPQNIPVISIRFKYTDICKINKNIFTSILCYLNGNPAIYAVSSTPPLIPNAQYKSDKLCEGLNIHFQDASVVAGGTITSWQWNFGNGFTSNLSNPSVSYISPGTYTLTLIVASSKGCKDTLNQSIHVNSSPSANYSYLTNCNSDTVIFNNTSTIAIGTIASWQWNFGDNTNGTQKNPHHYYVNGGNYTVQLTAISDSGCTSQSIQTIAITTPSALFKVSNNCTGNLVHFTDQSGVSSGTINGWFWNFGDGSTSVLQNPTHTYAAAGSYTVSLKITTSQNCSDSTAQIIQIENKPLVNFSADSLKGCAPLNVHFTDQSTASLSSVYLWDFGDAAQSSGKNPVHAYGNDGVYSVKLKITASSGCSDSTLKTAYIQVYSKPIALFSSAGSCSGLPVIFSENSTISNGSLALWQWDFGDNQTGNSQQPTHTYANAGNYNVSLIVSSTKGCSDTINKIISIQSKPIVKFGTTTLNGCQPLQVNFKDSSIVGTNAVYNWSFGDNQFSSSTNPLHLYTSSGTYTVKLTIHTGGACSDSLTKTNYIKVNPKPLANFSFQNACIGSTSNFNDLSTINGGIIGSWNWNFGDGTTANQQNPLHQYNNAGSYTVSLIIQSTFLCSDTLHKTITIIQKPLVKFKADSLAGCSPLNVNFSDSSITTPGSTYFWDFGDNTTSAIKNPAHTYNNSGSYNIKLFVSASVGCTDSLVKTAYIKVYAHPSANFTVNNGCTLSTINFTDNSGIPSGSTINSWFWTFGDGNSSTAHQPNYIYSNAGIYLVHLTVKSNFNCVDTISKTIIIENKPIIKFGGDTISGCLPLPVSFKDSSLTASGSNYFWSFGDTHTSNIKNPVNVYALSGLYTVKLVIKTPIGCTDSLTKTNYVQVYSLPTAYFSFNPDSAHIPHALIHFNNLSIDDNQWNWDFGDQQYSSVQFPNHTYSNAGLYTACLTVKNSHQCSNTYCDTITVFNPEIVAIPNAFSPNDDHHNDILKVRGGPLVNMELRIYNEWGNLLFFSKAQNEGWDGKYNGTPQPNGLYEYFLKGKTVNNIEINMHGPVSILR